MSSDTENLCAKCGHSDKMHYTSEVNGCRFRIVQNGTQFSQTCLCSGYRSMND